MKKALIVVNLAGFLTFLWNDIKTLQSLGYDVEVAMNGKMKDGSDAIEVAALKEMSIRWHQVDFDTKSPFSKENLRAFSQLRRIIKNKYDLIHCHTPIAGLLTRMAAIKFGKHQTKIIYTSHGFAFTDRSGIKPWIMYFSAEFVASIFTDAIITINHEDYKNAKKMLCKKVYLISGVGVNIKRYESVDVDRTEYRKRLGVTDDDIMVLSVGELSARKNHKIILEALATIEHKEKYVYVVCGREVVNSGIVQQLTDYAEKKGLRLVLAGHRGDIPEMNHSADIAAIPSLREGLGLAGIEALAAGIPVVGSNVQGIREYVVDGETGYLCNPTDANEFAIAIEKLASLSETRKKVMKELCIKKSQMFDASISNEQMRTIYLQVI